MRRKAKQSGVEKPKKGKDWYTVNAVLNHKLVKGGRIELEVEWEGYEETTWENFEGFAKDNPREVEKHFTKALINPYTKILD